MSIRTRLNSYTKTSSTGTDLSTLSPAIAETIRSLHATFKECKPTPLSRLPGLAAELGLKNVFVRDESKRSGLNAFKVLGGPYPTGGCLAHKIHLPLQNLTHNSPETPAAKTKAGDTTFMTTTDGNHGRGLARTAREPGCKRIVFMSKGSKEIHQNNILAERAQCTVTSIMMRQYA